MDKHAEALRRAYELLKKKQRQEALALLRELVTERPDDHHVWWLLANAVTEHEKKRRALQRALSIKPDFATAQAALEKLDSHYLTVDAPTKTQGLEDAAAQAKTPPTAYALLLMGVIMMSLTIGAAVIVLMGTGEADSNPNPDPQQAAERPESIIVTSEATSRGNATLPPPPSPTPVVTRIFPTFTPRPTIFIPPSPTFSGIFIPVDSIVAGQGAGSSSQGSGAAPQIGSDYWYGYDGSMNQYQYNGRFYRFYEFPVKLWVGTTPSGIFSSAVDHAIGEISQVLSFERVSSESNADLVLDFLPQRELQNFCGASVQIIGCAYLTYDNEHFLLTGEVNYFGFAMISRDIEESRVARIVVLHELLHAVGVLVHSNDPRDVMYFRYEETFGQIQNDSMTERDLNTLQRLYNSPAYGAED